MHALGFYPINTSNIKSMAIQHIDHQHSSTHAHRLRSTNAWIRRLERNMNQTNLLICKPRKITELISTLRMWHSILDTKSYISQEFCIKQEHLCKYTLISLFMITSSCYFQFSLKYFLLFNHWKNNVTHVFECTSEHTQIQIGIK